MVKKGIRKESRGPMACEHTINLHKRLHKIKFKARAPKAIKEIRKFAAKEMGTSDVRVDVKLNEYLWHRGIKSVPRRVRILIERKLNDADDAEESMYSYVTVAENPNETRKGTEKKDGGDA